MKRTELRELHYISPIVNVPSVLTQGILSHRGVARACPDHDSIAMPEVQDRRALVILPTGKPLHEYVNLYVHARNPMMYKRKALHETLCVLRIGTGVLDIPGVVVTDRNAGTGIVRWYSPERGITALDANLVFARSWIHSGDDVATRNHRAIRCAEVLVPDRVGPEYIFGAYVSCKQAEQALQAAAKGLPVVVNGDMFFRPGG